MADEVEIITTNAAADGWVDDIPDAVSTGYQIQNTVMQAIFNGFDNTSISISGSNIIISVSGIIDDSGVPFVVKSQITLTLPTTGFNWFLKVVAGSTVLLREIEFTDDRGTYDTTKNAFYNGSGERILNWMYNEPSEELNRIRGDKPTDELKLGSYLEINTGTTQVLVDEAVEKVTAFGAITTDRLKEWEFAVSDRITLRESGMRQFIFTLSVSFLNSGIFELRKNGVAISSIDVRAPSSSEREIQLIYEDEFIIDDYVELYIENASGITSNIIGANSRLVMSSNKELF